MKNKLYTVYRYEIYTVYEFYFISRKLIINKDVFKIFESHEMILVVNGHIQGENFQHFSLILTRDREYFLRFQNLPNIKQVQKQSFIFDYVKFADF